MSGQVSWILELDILEGRENDLRRLAAEMISSTNVNEPGTLAYEWSISADGKRCHIFERYADSAALLAHAATFGEKFAGHFSGDPQTRALCSLRRAIRRRTRCDCGFTARLYALFERIFPVTESALPGSGAQRAFTFRSINPIRRAAKSPKKEAFQLQLPAC